MVVFTATVVLLMPQALGGQRTYAAVDLLQLGSPYRDVIDAPPAPELAAPIQTDQVETFPWPASFFRELRHGDWQLWEPNVAGGIPTGTLPLLGVLSPFSVGYLVLPAWYAVTVKAALVLLVSQWFTYLLLRRLGAGTMASTLAGVAYAYTGTNLVLLHRVGAVALAPALLWATHRLVERPSLRHTGLVAFLVAWTWFEGFPAGFVYCMYLTAAWGLWLAVARLRASRGTTTLRQRLGDPVRRLGALAAAGALGLGIAAVNLVPFIDEVLTRQTLGTRLTTDSHAHLPTSNVFGLIDHSAIGPPWWTGIHPIENVATIGTITVLAAAAGLVASVRRRLLLTRNGAAAWSFLCGIGIFGILTSYVGTFVLGLVYNLPGLADNPVHRLRFLIAIAAAGLAALSLDAWWHAGGPAAERRVHAPRGISAFTLLFYLGAATLGANDFVDDVARAGRSSEVARAVGIGLLLAVAALLLAWAGRRWRHLAPVAAVAIAGLLFAQLAWPLRDFTPQADRDLYYTTQQGHRTLHKLVGDRYRFSGAGFYTFYPNTAQLLDVPDLRGFALHSTEFRDLVGAAAPAAVARDPFKIVPDRDSWNFSSPVLDDLSVRIVVLSTDELPFGDIVASTDSWSRWRDPDRLGPEAWRSSAPGPITGILVPLEHSGACRGARIRVTLSTDGRTVDSAERPAFDAEGGWMSFALTGQEVGAGEAYDLAIATLGAACSVQVGTIGSGAGERVATQPIIEPPEQPLRLVATGQGWFYRRPTALPLVRAHSDWRAFETQAQLLRWVARRPASERHVAAFVGDEPDFGGGGVPSSVESFDIDDERVRAEIRGASRNLVVVAQNFSDGWEARVDGEPAPIVSVDGALMGVFVPKGEHEVTLEYRPRSFRVGSVISLGALVVLVGLLVVAARRRQRERSR
ncbi:MAG: YfhO family protein [Acidimicrobiia bacterium]